MCHYNVLEVERGERWPRCIYWYRPAFSVRGSEAAGGERREISCVGTPARRATNTAPHDRIVSQSVSQYSMEPLITLLALSSLSLSTVTAFCPGLCVCDQQSLQVTCFQTKLEVKYWQHFNILTF